MQHTDFFTKIGWAGKSLTILETGLGQASARSDHRTTYILCPYLYCSADIPDSWWIGCPFGMSDIA